MAQPVVSDLILAQVSLRVVRASPMSGSAIGMEPA